MDLLVAVVSVLGFLYAVRLLYKFRFLYADTPRLKYVYGLSALFWLTLFFSALFRDNYLLLTAFALLIAHWVFRTYSNRKTMAEIKEITDSAVIRAGVDRKEEAENTSEKQDAEKEENDRKFTEIVTAIANGDLEVAEEELSGGFDVYYVSTETDSQMLSLLLQQGQGELILKTAVSIVSKDKYTQEERDEYRDLLEQHEKFETGCLLLLSLGAEVNANDGNGRSNLMLAAKHGFNKVLESLIRSGADLDTQRYDGTTALHEAVRARAVECTRLLVQAGASTDIENRDGKLALDYATDDAIIEVLRSH